MNDEQRTGLLDLVLDAHGGRQVWRRARTIRAHLHMVGPTWTGLGQEKTFAGIAVAVDVQRQRTEFTDFTGRGLRGVYTPKRVTIEDADGAVLQGRRLPRESFPPRGRETKWDALHALYFAGYGMWNYLTNPYLLTLPGVATEELEPWQAGGHHWRRLHVTFPSYLATHSTQQTFYYDERGLQRRVDYAPYVLGSPPAAHHTESHQRASGLVFPTHRYVLPVVEGKPVAQPSIVLDLHDLAVEFAGEAQTFEGGRE